MLILFCNLFHDISQLNFIICYIKFFVFAEGNLFRKTSKFQRVYASDCYSPKQQPIQQHFSSQQVDLSIPQQHINNYSTLQPHWFYSTKTKSLTNDNSPTKTNISWFPFSHLDSSTLENAFMHGCFCVVSSSLQYFLLYLYFPTMNIFVTTLFYFKSVFSLISIYIFNSYL